MEYTGLTSKYPVNRPLTDREREFQLHQEQRLELEPAHQLSVIRLNSTFLELVDKYYGWKGFITTTCIAGLVVAGGGGLYGFGALMLDAYQAAAGEEAPWGYALLALAMVLPLIWLLVWLLRKESFAYTHYPIRLNRKTRMIHLFRLDGSILSVPWEEVFFCLGALRQGNWEIQAHVLDQDRVTVRETFAAFPQIGGNSAEREKLKHFWEFIRRYMEEGPRDTFERAQVCVPVAERRESVSFGFHRMHVESGTNLVFVVIGALMALALLPGRWIAMRTSKIPVWPKEIDHVCRVDPSDPFIRDASMNPPGLR